MTCRSFVPHPNLVLYSTLLYTPFHVITLPSASTNPQSTFISTFGALRCIFVHNYALTRCRQQELSAAHHSNDSKPCAEHTLLSSRRT